MPIIPGTKESYIGALLENIIYGVYLSVFSECCVLFYKKKARGAVHRYLMATTGLMFALITMRCIIDTYRCIVAFNNEDLDFGPPNAPLGALTNACWLLVTPVADVFIVFRTFIVWERNWLIIIIPSLLCLANTIISILAIISFEELAGTNSAVWSSVDWLNAFISLTLTTNIICTGLISFRIVQVYRRVASMVSGNSGRTDSMRILSVIFESASMYTAVLLATLVVARLKGFAVFILIDCLPPTIGLVFSYIIIRVSRGTSYGESTVNGTTTSLGRYRPNNRPFDSGQSFSTRSAGKSEVQIRLERTTDGPMGIEMDSSSANEEVNVAKYAAA
ncbi:hypothetical protein B0H14DRAFT_3056770 [Mycena olivaceomarginata]|nr:hypothetical protein B0H14DRAFT_3056770 [Mycena olivaceomarginata]